MAKSLTKPTEIGESTRKSFEEKPILMKGKVIANTLNIRAQASKESEVLGKLSKDDKVEIISLKDGWYEIKFNDSIAFVVSEFVEEYTKRGFVNANILNIRSLPNKDGEKIVQITKDTEVLIVDEIDGWYKIKYKDGFGYVFGEFISLKEGNSSVASGTTKVDGPKRSYLFEDPELLNTMVEPANKLDLAGSDREKKVKTTYNKYGNLLGILSKRIGIELAVANAFITIESGSFAFHKDKVLIRFENHLFYDYWGKDNEEIFKQHFKYSAKPRWEGHFFRKGPSGEWISFHGNQDLENEVLDFARSLDDEKALQSISMGLPQILGTNAQAIGYNSAREMYDAFTKDLKYHLFGLFDFFSPRMIGYLKNREFVKIAEIYNGKGQAVRYGGMFQDCYDAFPKNLA